MSEHGDDSIPKLPSTSSDCFSIEMEFLVAKELPDTEYYYPSDNTDDSLNVIRWVCPPDEKDPCTVVLNACKDLLDKNNEEVIVSYDPSPESDTTRYVPDRAFPNAKLDRLDCWRLSPSTHARAKPGSPPEYDWFGVRLCSPYYPFETLFDEDSQAKWMPAVFRLGLLMHVNSSCRLNVSVLPCLEPITLVMAKKLTTMVWLVERDLLLRVCPNSQGEQFDHVKPLDSHSRVATTCWKGREDSRPEDPLRAGIMDHYLPDLHDNVLRERIHYIWGIATMEELIKALSCNDGKPSSFGFRVWDGPERPPECTAEFRYSLWHPYDKLDATNYWVQLSVFLCHVMSCSASYYREMVERVDSVISEFSVLQIPPSYRWKMLLEKMVELPEDWAAPWQKTVEEYRTGRQLAYPNIDRYGVIKQIEDFHVYQQNWDRKMKKKR